MRIGLILALLTQCISAYAQSPEPLQTDDSAPALPQKEIRAELPEEDQVRIAKETGVLSQYERAIHDHILRSWVPPLTAAPDLECVITVTQVPSGEVIGVSFGPCNGDAAVRGSIEAAVRHASPLPRPPMPSLFSRNIEVIFRMGQ